MEQPDKIKKDAGVGDEVADTAGKVRDLAAVACDKALAAGKTVVAQALLIYYTIRRD